jgi:hypothetical protein
MRKAPGTQIMDLKDKIEQLLKKYFDGWYTTGEIVLLLALNTPEGRERDLIKMLPSQVLNALKDWVTTYPLEGGIQIRDSAERLPKAVLVRFKNALVSE